MPKFLGINAAANKSAGNVMPTKEKSKFLTDVRSKLRYKHYSLRTEKSYVGWIKQLILFHRRRTQENNKEDNEKKYSEVLY